MWVGVGCDADASYPTYHPSRQHLLPLLFTYSAAKQFPIPGVYLANIHQCDRFLSRIYGNA
ncbi:hypothetical protein DXT09_21875 [Escherichia coli]|nr:hypothetical protein [Escherichia coli]EGO9211121.1 hypothetical protein [Escherichia coli]EGO9481433.1 hypothetical protein [Escherichia coli]OTB61142.1 hypothetical protein AW065_23850 [Escherichia coli]OTC21466.1 hypothetical protein AW073_15910 [Escherichia coli]